MPPKRDPAWHARVEKSTKSLLENPWLNRLDLDEDDLQMLQMVQNSYIDSGDISTWDIPRESSWLTPGVDPSLCDEDGSQELPFVWRGVRKNEPNMVYNNESITKGKIRINWHNTTLEGYFGFIHGNGSAGGDLNGDRKCAFYAKKHVGPHIVPYTLEDTVEQWNDWRSFSVLHVKVRQFLSPVDRATDLRKRDEGSDYVTDDEENDDTSLVSQDSSDSQLIMGHVVDNHGKSIPVRFRVDLKNDLIVGKFDGNFRNVFQGQDSS
ncbi:Hypothetical protein PENO1_108960 [Penicillium occitanis (nom. inval.)]|nr:Hypothetical protein PENO1_108960 [Penicillium occitanis (nom. inval.)]PCG88796.1 hypothetical protein PENOC_109330 [Penicillium occitanis (nom. inval.)]